MIVVSTHNFADKDYLSIISSREYDCNCCKTIRHEEYTLQDGLRKINDSNS